MNHLFTLRVTQLSTFLRWALVIAFAWSGGGKILWPAAFQNALAKLGMLPTALIPATAYTLPGLELAIALGLASQSARLPAACASLFLSAVFLGVHGYSMATGTLVPCGCAGVALRFDSWKFHVTMPAASALMLAASFVLLANTSAKSSPKPPGTDPRVPPGTPAAR
jgi:hypothetical protein